AHRDVVREQLQRNDFEQWHEQLRRGRKLDEMVGSFASQPVAGRHDGNDDTIARFNLFYVGHALFVESDGLAIVVVARGQHNDGQVFVDERVGPVLHFASGIAFRVNVRNFLELEGAFESDRIVNAAAQIKKIGVTEEEFGEIFVEAGRVGLQNAFNL